MSVTQIPTAPPSAAAGITRTVAGDADSFVDDLTPEQIETLEQRTGVKFSDVLETVNLCQQQKQGMPFWVLSFMMYGMALRQYPDLSYDEFRRSTITDITGKDIGPSSVTG